MDTADSTDKPQAAPERVVNMRQAAKLAKVSEVTLRKYLRSGELSARKVQGDYGQTWAIDYDDLAAFVRRQWGRRLSVRGTSVDTPQLAGADSLRQLRDELDAALVEIGRYRQLAAGNEATAGEVERILKERIAELEAEVGQLRDRPGFWRRLFG